MRSNSRFIRASTGFVACLVGMTVAATVEPPATVRQTVSDTYHGVEIDDPYRWLETWDDPAVRDWSDAQNLCARNYLDALPDIEKVRDAMGTLLRSRSATYTELTWGQLRTKPDRYLALKSDPTKQQPVLVAIWDLDDPSDQGVLVDPNRLDPTGGLTIDWFVPSPDGLRLAVSLSRGGSERGDVHVYDLETFELTGEVVQHVNGGTAGGSLAWFADSSAFLYTRYPAPGERPEADLDFYQQLWLHRLGTPQTEDEPELTELTRIAEIKVLADHVGGRFLATVQDGDSGRFKHAIRDATGQWDWFTTFGDGHQQALFGPDHRLYVISFADAPRGRLLVTHAGRPDMSSAVSFVQEGEETLVADFWEPEVAVSTPDRLYLTYQLGGPTEIRAFTHRGLQRAASPEQLPVSSVGHLITNGAGDLLFHTTSYREPGVWRRFDGRETTSVLTTVSPVSFDDSEVRREFATSKDGTRVPVNILIPKDAPMDGSSPVLLSGYGGYGISIEPRFRATNRLWLDRGGVVCVANIRGGGEYGEAWHRGGNLTRKQNVFDDFAAVMQHLIDRGYTSPERLAIVGGSNGGLLMGAMITQHPDLFRASVSHVGIYDMLRVELSPNGAFNIPEFGSVTDAGQFRALHAYSPYHRVEQARAYPSVLFMTGANDPRVDPMHSRKMSAALQWATGSENPVLLRTSSNTGHGGATPLDERIEQQTDQLSFLLDALGIGWE